jgi:hypothetical protein
MTKIYRGTSAEWVEQYIKGTGTKAFDPTGSGEFGVGCYFWLDDPAAAFMSAVQYNGNERDWGVLEVEFDETALQQLASRDAGYGSRVLEFKHDRASPFGDNKPGNFVVPKDHSHLAVNRTDQATHLPAKATAPHPGAFGKMQSQQFRAINAAPEKFGLDGEKNVLVWQYDLIIGLCAADYQDHALVQMKFANHGMTFINNLTLCTRRKIVTGKKITKAWSKVSSWKMRDRHDLYAKYCTGKTTVNLDAELG